MPALPVVFDDVLAAAERIAPFVHRTPVLTCSTLNRLVGAEVFFKCENFQKVGAFKFRGASNAVALLTQEQRERGVVTHSSGNHAQAVALAAAMQGVDATIVMPDDASPVKVAATKGYGATVVQCPAADRAKVAEELVGREDRILVHPSNDPAVIAGQGTAALELLDEAHDMDMVLAPVGGGGIASGTAVVVKRLLKNATVIAAEPEMADDAFRSLQTGAIQPSTHPDTIADGLRTSLGDNTFAIIRQLVDEIVLVEEAEILDAMRFVWERMKIVIEPSSAVPLAPILTGKLSVKGRRVGVILTGGNVDVSRFFEQPTSPRS